MPTPLPCRLASADDIHRALDMPRCLRAVEEAFLLSAAPGAIPPATSGIVAGDGTFHVKSAVSNASDRGGRRFFVAKVNANFPANPARNGRPTIQGILVLFDAEIGTPIALMDSGAITVLRTAAATGVAAKYLALPDADTVAIIGCGAQAVAQLAAVCAVRPVRHVRTFDIVSGLADRFADEARARFGVDAVAASSLSQATDGCGIIVTTTPSTEAFLEPAHAMPGALIAGVGADNPAKSEIAPALMTSAAVVTDSTAQCAMMGDLHHAIAAGVMSAEDVRAELAQVIADPDRGRRSSYEVIIFDSTGLAFQDVAAASVVYERLSDRTGTLFAFV